MNQIGGERWQQIVMPVGVAVFYRDTLALDIPHGCKPIAERNVIGGEYVRRTTVEEAY